MGKMKIHSDTAWNIASLYSHVLASETRDLAAHIDLVLDQNRETIDELVKALKEARFYMPDYNGVVEADALMRIDKVLSKALTRAKQSKGEA